MNRSVLNFPKLKTYSQILWAASYTAFNYTITPKPRQTTQAALATHTLTHSVELQDAAGTEPA